MHKLNRMMSQSHYPYISYTAIDKWENHLNIAARNNVSRPVPIGVR